MTVQDKSVIGRKWTLDTKSVVFKANYKNYPKGMEENLEQENYKLRQEIQSLEALRQKELSMAELKAKSEREKSTEILAIALVFLVCAIVIIIGLVSSQG